MGWKIRKNPLIKGNIAYQAYCICKWKDKYSNGEDAWVPKRMLVARYVKHYLKVKEQQLHETPTESIF